MTSTIFKRDDVMADNNKTKIWIQLADVKPIPLSVDPEDEPTYREAENLVNTLWNRWMNRFSDSGASQDVMARVAFQFARLYIEAYKENQLVNDFLTDFEKQLDDASQQASDDKE